MPVECIRCEMDSKAQISALKVDALDCLARYFFIAGRTHKEELTEEEEEKLLTKLQQNFYKDLKSDE